MKNTEKTTCTKHSWISDGWDRARCEACNKRSSWKRINAAVKAANVAKALKTAKQPATEAENRMLAAAEANGIEQNTAMMQEQKEALAAHLNNRPAAAVAQQAPITLAELLVLDRLAKRYAEWCSQRGYAVFAQQCGSFIEMVEVDARQMGGSAAPWTHEIHCLKCGAALRPMPASISPMQMPAITCSCATFIVGIDDINAEPFQGWPATMFDIHAVAKGGR